MAPSLTHTEYLSNSSRVFPHHVTQKQEDVNQGYFIVRPNGGPLVPLIPVDELPVGLEFVGLKRSMDVEDTIGMVNLGIRINKVGYWMLVEKVVTEIQCGVCKALNEGDNGDAAAGVVASGKPASGPLDTSIAHAIVTSVSYAAPVMVTSSPTTVTNQPLTSPIAASTTSAGQLLPTATSTPPLPTTIKVSQSPHIIQQPINLPIQIKPTPSAPTGPGIIGPFEPQICKHWCAFGTCRWADNCRYLHIMPTSRSGLQRIGLADWPSWWRTLVGIPTEITNGSDGNRLREKETMGVYPTGSRERYSRGLNIDYGRSAGDAKLAREWEERLMKERARVSWKTKGRNLSGNAKGQGKQKRVMKPQFLQTVVRDGKIVGVGISDGSMLKSVTDIDTKVNATEKTADGAQAVSSVAQKLDKLIPGRGAEDPKMMATQEPVVVKEKKRRESVSEMTTEKRLDQDVARATMAWENDDGGEGEGNGESVAYVKHKVESEQVSLQQIGVLVDI